MAQIARPDSDISAGSWSPFPTDPTTLFDKIDEETPNGDTDYITSDLDEDECEVGVGDVTDPEIGTGHVIRCYAKSPNGGGAKEQMTIALVENGNVRGISPATNVDRTGYGLIEYALSEAEANAIQNYPDLRLRFHITKVNSNEPIRITQADFRCPDAATEFIYDGDVPVSVLPDEPKGVLSKSYAGAVALSVLPSYASILDRVYAGAIPLVMMSDAPMAPLSKSYGGDVGLVLTPNSIYELISETEFVYAGDIPLVALPSYSSILDRVYAGDTQMFLTPSSQRILDMVYGGDIPVVFTPSSVRILDRIYQGAVILVLTPDSGYLLESPGTEFIYAGDIPISLLSGYSSALEKAYGGDIGFVLMPGSLYSGIRVGPALGSQISREKPELLLIKKPDEITFIGKKKPVFISEDTE